MEVHHNHNKKKDKIEVIHKAIIQTQIILINKLELSTIFQV